MAQVAKPGPRLPLPGSASCGWLGWGFTYLGLCWMERSARLKARLRQDSSAELISRCKFVCTGGKGRSMTG